MLKTLERLILKYYVQTIYTVSRVCPIKQRVVYATNRTTQLVDNFKFIDEEMTRQSLPYQRVYLFKKMERGFIKRMGYLLHLGKATYYLATSRFFLIDDFYFPVYVVSLRKGTEVVQTWHACGAFKKFGYSILDKEYGANNDYVKYIPIHKNYSHVLVSAKEVVPYYAEAFNMDASRIRPLGVPRTDLFFNDRLQQEAKTRLYEMYPMLEGKRLILYAPTFRGATQADMHMSIPFDLNRVSASLNDGTILGLKMHPFVKDLPDLTGYENVVDLSRYPEVNDILLESEVLITDYSSLVFEYALLERPMIFYAHDRQTYAKERDFYYNYEDFIPGPLVETTEDLIQALKNDSFDLARIRTFKAKFFDQADGRATERVVNAIFKSS